MIFTWAFEMTPDGLKKEKDVDRSQSITPQTGKKLNRAITIMMALAIGYLLFDKFSEVGSESNSPDPGAQTNRVVGENLTLTPVEIKPGEATPEPVANKPAGASIAVLPFVNMSDDGANEYFSDGLSEELLNLLAKVPELKVAARTSSFQFKGKTGDIETIAEQLKVANVLEGSVRKAGNQVRITAQLIKADDGYHLWSESYDRTLDNIFVVQDEIASAVVDALKLTLLGAVTPLTKEADPAAYTLFLQGRYLYNQASEENFAKAAVAFAGAIDHDPDYAPAWAGLSEVTLTQAGQDFIELDAGVEKARDAAQRAVTLDPELAVGWVRLSNIQARYKWNWSAANESMQKALQLEPNSSEVMSGAAELAGILGQLDQSLALYRQASAIDPLNQPALDHLGSALLAAGQVAEALQVRHRLHTLNPDFFQLHFSLGWLALRRGLAEQALIEAEQEPDKFWRIFLKSMALFSLGKQSEADAKLVAMKEEYHRYGAYQIAEVYGWRSEADPAFKWLEQAYEQRDPGLGELLGDNALRNLHKDPRWPELLEKIGLLDAWNEMPARHKGPLQ
jgi:adenylate cyclase